MNKNLKEKILKLRQEGKTYQQIADELQCSKSSVCFHCGNGQKEKFRIRKQKHRKSHPFISKINSFFIKKQTTDTRKITNSTKKKLYKKIWFFTTRGTKMIRTSEPPTFTVEDVVNKYGPEYKCYITGESIDIDNTESYHFDHIVPVSKGGNNSIDNLGICTRQANLSKTDMTLDEYLSLCKQSLEYNGYQVTKI